jgi:hypothetical protein
MEFEERGSPYFVNKYYEDKKKDTLENPPKDNPPHSPNKTEKNA